MSIFNTYFTDKVLKSDGWTQVKCPFHDDSVASSGVNVKEGKFHCFTCGITYNETQFLAKLSNISESDAVAFLEFAQENSISWEETHQRKLFANNDFLSTVRNYFKVDNNFITTLQLGMEEWKGVPMLSFPIFYNNIRLGATHYNITKDLSVAKSKIDVGTEVGLVIPYDLWQKDKRTTYLVEGEKDMLAARAFGINAITLVGGAGASLHELSRGAFQDRDVVVIYDKDEAGRNGAYKRYLELKDIVKSIKYIDISDVVKEEKEDFFDAVYKYDMDGLVFDFLERRDFTEKASKVHYTLLADAIKKGMVGRRLTSKITVPAEYSDVFLSKTAIRFTKEDINTGDIAFDKDKNKLPVGTSRIWRLKKNDPKDLLNLIEIKATDKDIYSNLRTKVGVPANEQFIKTEDLTTTNIYKVRMSDISADNMFNEDELENFTIDVYSFVKLNVGEEYVIEYYLYPHSNKHQKLVAIAVEATHQNNVKNFTPDPKILKEFQQEGSTKEHLQYLYKSARHHIAKHLNYNIWLMNDLVVNSVYEFPYSGRNYHGTLDVAIVGDPRSGKSETSERITQLYNFGQFVNLKTSSVVGLTAGSNKVDGSWLNTIGVLPRQHKRLVVMEELSGASPEFIKTMTDVRSSGRMRVARAAGQLDVPCRLRMITISNPVGSKDGEARDLATFPNGVQPITELIKASEDVARYDAFLLVPRPRYRVDPNTIVLTDYMIPKKAYEHKANWTYTRTVDNIEYENNDVVSYIWDKATELNDLFESSFSLFGTTTYLKLARLTVAMANLLMSTDDKYEKIIVKKEHVDAVVDFLISIYDNQTFKLKDYKLEWQSYNKATKHDVKVIQDLYSGNSVVLDYLANVSDVSRKNLQLISGDNQGFAALFSKLVAGKFVKLTGETVTPTGKLRQSMDKIERGIRADLELVSSVELDLDTDLF